MYSLLKTPRNATACGLVCLALTGQANQTPGRWWRISSGRWELVTDTGEKRGAAVLARLLEMRNLFSAVAIPLPASAPPTRVILFRSSADFAPFSPAPGVTGLYQAGAGADFILLLDIGEETLRAACHEYVHLVMRHSTARRPQWLEEGLAEYFSTLQRAGGNAVVGSPVKNLIAALSSPGWIPSEKFLAVTHDSKTYNDPSQFRLFYAQSWALVHVLMRSTGAPARLAAFLKHLGNGEPQEAAFERVYGRTIEAALDEARLAAERSHFPTQQVRAADSARPERVAAEPLSEPAWLMGRGEALLAGDKEKEAAAVYNAAARRWPKDAAVIAGLGYLAMWRADYAEARAQFERAMALGDNQATTYFEYAMLVRDTRGPLATYVEYLRKTVAARPSFAEAWFLLGTAVLRQSRAGEAVECLQKAVEIVPGNSMFWEALGRAQQAAGRNSDARESAARAIATAETPEQSAMAEGLERELDAPVLERGQKPAVTTPPAWESPRGDSSVQGRLTLVDCSGTLIRFHIQRSPSDTLILFAAQPDKVALRGRAEDKRGFACGPQAGTPQVKAGYNATRDAGAAGAGELVWLEFK